MLEHPYTPFKKNASKNMITVSGILGICKVEHLELGIIEKYYGSMKYTKDYDDLPLVLRMWLTNSNWNYVKQLAEMIGCNSLICYSDIVEISDYNSEECALLTMPLIIMDEENAVCLAPKEIRPEHFEVKHLENLPHSLQLSKMKRRKRHECRKTTR